jgi:hypothetical protein
VNRRKEELREGIGGPPALLVLCMFTAGFVICTYRVAAEVLKRVYGVKGWRFTSSMTINMQININIAELLHASCSAKRVWSTIAYGVYSSACTSDCERVIRTSAYYATTINLITTD